MRPRQFTDNDFQPLEAMSLSWRWLSSSHVVLPDDARRTIRALRTSVAAEVERDLTELCAQKDLEERFDASAGEDAVQAWLMGLDVPETERIILSWDADNAVVTNWRTFVAYWSDFCYPASDDVTISPAAGHWVLCYNHMNQFSFQG